MSEFIFRPAVKEESLLRLEIAGPAGSGKTYSALAVASALVDGDGREKVALVDTEHKSASLYADVFQFSRVVLDPPFTVERYISAMDAAVAQGFEVVILDSTSHVWDGEGGLLEQKDYLAKNKYRGNSYAAWSDITPLYNRFVESMIRLDAHVIATTRAKSDYIQEEIAPGKTTYRKVGMGRIMRDGYEYNFGISLMFEAMNLVATVDKSRCHMLPPGALIEKPGADLAGTLMEWLSGEAPPTPEELWEMALSSEREEDFAYHVYRIPEVQESFQNEGKVVDFLKYVAGPYDVQRVDEYMTAVNVFVAQREAGEPTKVAAEAAKSALSSAPEQDGAGEKNDAKD